MSDIAAVIARLEEDAADMASDMLATPSADDILALIAAYEENTHWRDEWREAARAAQARAERAEKALVYSARQAEARKHIGALLGHLYWERPDLCPTEGVPDPPSNPQDDVAAARAFLASTEPHGKLEQAIRSPDPRDHEPYNRSRNTYRG